MSPSLQPARRRLLALPLILLAALVSGTPAPATVVLLDSEHALPPGMISARLLPAQPSSRVFDATGQLDAKAEAELAVALAKAAEGGIDIHTVILDATPDIEPDKLGNELVRRWTPPEATIGVLVLSLPAVDEPFLFLFTRLLSPAETDILSALAREALANADTPPRAYGAALELAANLPDTLADITQARAGQPVLHKSPLPVEPSAAAPPATPPAAVPPQSAHSHWDLMVSRIDPRIKILLRDLAIGFGGLVLLAATLVIVRLRRPRYFPQVEFRHRFQAPYSGGNNARAATTRPPASSAHVPYG